MADSDMIKKLLEVIEKFIQGKLIFEEVSMIW